MKWDNTDLHKRFESKKKRKKKIVVSAFTKYIVTFNDLVKLYVEYLKKDFFKKIPKPFKFSKSFISKIAVSQQTFICPKSTIETLEETLKHVQG